MLADGEGDDMELKGISLSKLKKMAEDPTISKEDFDEVIRRIEILSKGR